MSEPLIALDRSELVWVTGSDAVSFLDGLLSQSIAGVPIGGTAWSLLLAPNGKLRATLFVLRGEHRIGLVCDRNRAEVVAGDLRRFKIRVDVKITIDDRPVWEAWGDGADEIISDLPEAGRWDDREGALRFRMPFHRVGGKRVVVVGAEPPRGPVVEGELEAFRIAVGEPIMGVDLDDKTIPQEGVAIGDYVDFTKGCYLGQELVARIDSRGHVNRRLFGVTLAGTQVPDPGSEIVAADQPVGTLTSAALSSEHGVIGLAMLRVEIAPGTAIEIAGISGAVVALPMFE